MLILSSIAMIISLFVPIWVIYLDAPQYPEGLSLEIWANAIAGDVDIINGLNHYIGMKTLNTDDFFEFKILPYIIVLFALFFILTVIADSKRLLYISFWAFVVFGIISMVDFWKWEYNYGHNLDPNAAIIVPDMAYQPPLIGFKQLLNFGAFSVPDIGGWLFVIAGLLILSAVLQEKSVFKRIYKKATTGSFILMVIILHGCGEREPEPIQLHKDACAYCKMSISVGNFASEFITRKGRVYKFDDITCMYAYAQENNETEIDRYYVADYSKANNLINATAAWYIHSDQIKSPMAGGIAAFSERSAAEGMGKIMNVPVKTWSEINLVFSTHVKDEMRD